MSGLIFWSSLWVVLLCVWFSQKNECQFKKNIALGTALPREAREDPEVLGILQKYRKDLDRVCLILGVICVAGALIPDMAVSLIGCCIMLILDLVLPMTLFAGANGRLRAIKTERGWRQKQTVRVDLSVMIDYPRPRALPCFLAAALCLIPAIFRSRLGWIHLLPASMAILSYFCGAFCYRKKSETVDENKERTRALSRLRYGMWNRIWLAGGWSAVLLSSGLWLTELSLPAGISLLLLTSLGFCGYALAVELQTRKIQEILTADSGKEWYADEDDCWIWGLFYYNPNDSHMLVNARTGAGSTFNLASRGGKIVTGLVTAIFVGAIVLLISLGLADRSEIRLDLSRDIVYCENGSTRYEVPLPDIEDLELLTEMPEDLWRTNGVGGQHLMKGSFLGDGLPDLKVIADPTTPPYLLIRTEERQYLFGTRDPALTEALFETLRERISQ